MLSEYLRGLKSMLSKLVKRIKSLIFPNKWRLNNGSTITFKSLDEGTLSGHPDQYYVFLEGYLDEAPCPDRSSHLR